MDKQEELKNAINFQADKLETLIKAYIGIVASSHKKAYEAYRDEPLHRSINAPSAASAVKTLLDSVAARATHNPINGAKPDIRYL